MNLGETINSILGWLEGKKTYIGLTALTTLGVLRAWGLGAPWWLFIVLGGLTLAFVKAGFNRDYNG